MPISSSIGEFREQQALQEQAARLGLSGLANGVSRHDFIEFRMNQHSERFLRLMQDGKTEQVDREVELLKIELKEA
jgi:hypothetical protein